VKSGWDRHVRVFVLAAATLGLVACVGGQPQLLPSSPAASAPTAPGNEPSPAPNAVIAWVDRATAQYVAPSPSLPPADARRCAAAAVRASVGHVQAAMSNTNLPVALVNVSSSVCSLVGEPTLVGVDATGGHHVIRVRDGSYFGDPGPPANVTPGGTGAVNISGGDACDAWLTHHRVYPTLLVSLPGGGSVAVDGHEFDTICGVSVSAFGVPSLATPAPDIPPLLITATISAPDRCRWDDPRLYRHTHEPDANRLFTQPMSVVHRSGRFRPTYVAGDRAVLLPQLRHGALDPGTWLRPVRDASRPSARPAARVCEVQPVASGRRPAVGGRPT
jgi:Protein of unknown function (DUF4232)